MVTAEQTVPRNPLVKKLASVTPIRSPKKPLAQATGQLSINPAKILQILTEARILPQGADRLNTLEIQLIALGQETLPYLLEELQAGTMSSQGLAVMVLLRLGTAARPLVAKALASQSIPTMLANFLKHHFAL